MPLRGGARGPRALAGSGSGDLVPAAPLMHRSDKPRPRWARHFGYAATVASRSERELAERLGRLRALLGDKVGSPPRFDHPARYWVGTLGEAMFVDLLDYVGVTYTWHGGVDNDPDVTTLDHAGEPFRTVEVKTCRLYDGEIIAFPTHELKTDMLAFMVITLEPLEPGQDTDVNDVKPVAIQLVGGCSTAWWDKKAGTIPAGDVICPRRKAASKTNRWIAIEDLPLNAAELVVKLTPPAKEEGTP